jgi:hypothetical protein
VEAEGHRFASTRPHQLRDLTIEQEEPPCP